MDSSLTTFSSNFMTNTLMYTLLSNATSLDICPRLRPSLTVAPDLWIYYGAEQTKSASKCESILYFECKFLSLSKQCSHT